MAENLRARKKLLARESIIEAAIEAFARDGFRETRVENIAKGAGTTVATFYRYFSSKGDLMVPVQGRLTNEVEACLAKLTEEDIRSPRALRRWLDQYIQMWDRIHRLCEAFWEATTADEEFANRIFPEAFSPSDVIDRLIAHRSDADRERLHIRMGMILTALDRFVFLASVAPNEALAEKIRDETAGILWDSMFADR